MADEQDTEGMAYYPALVIGGNTTPEQRAKNWKLYKRLEEGLRAFVYEVPISRMSLGPHGEASFRIDPGSDCYRRLLHVIADHFDDGTD